MRSANGVLTATDPLCCPGMSGIVAGVERKDEARRDEARERRGETRRGEVVTDEAVRPGLLLKKNVPN